MKQLRWLAATAACVSAMIVPAQAQEPPDVIVHKEVRVAPGEGGPNMIYFRNDAGPGPVTMDFIGAEMSIGGPPVKGAPYTADAVTETTQTLSDGNRITRKSTSTVYRDSQGRTRREETMSAVGPWAAAGEQMKTIFIQDPVAGVSYHLDPQAHIAHKLPMGKMGFVMAGAGGPGGPGGPRVIAMQRTVTAQALAPDAAAAGKAVTVSVEGPVDGPAIKVAKPDVKTEALGKRTIEGVEAEGSRSTITLPEGAIGNERPIASVSERWYSSELQSVVMSKRSDPRFGDTTYQLVNVQRGEQPPSLFEVPSDYTVRDDLSMANEKKLLDEKKMLRQKADDPK